MGAEGASGRSEVGKVDGAVHGDCEIHILFRKYVSYATR
jgi:hypothetical protein